MSRLGLASETMNAGDTGECESFLKNRVDRLGGGPYMPLHRTGRCFYGLLLTGRRHDGQPSPPPKKRGVRGCPALLFGGDGCQGNLVIVL